MTKAIMTIEQERNSMSLNRLVLSWAPVFCFMAICYGSYAFAYKKKSMAFEELKSRFEVLSVEKNEALSKRNDLQLQIQSQSDPLWIEQTLMRGLGLVPEGQKKIIFREN